MNVEWREFAVRIPTVGEESMPDSKTVKVPMEWDEELQEFLLTPEAHQIIEDTKARYIGLLLPAELKELRDRLNLTQRQIGDLLQIGEKSWTRWETGKQRPSRMANVLLRALYDGEISVGYLAHVSGVQVGWGRIVRWDYFKVVEKRPMRMTVSRAVAFGRFEEKTEVETDKPVALVA